MFRVGDEVEHELLDLFPIHQHRENAVVQLQLQRYIPLCQVELAQRRRRTRDLVEIRAGPLRRTAPNEREQVAHDLAGPRSFLADEIEVAPVARRPLFFDHQLDAADDRLQRVVDFMRHARDDFTDRREPLAVHQLVTQGELLGDVALDADEMGHAPVP